jgi:hypothetical protein
MLPLFKLSRISLMSFVAALSICLSLATSAKSGDDDPIVRIEQDWEITLNQPDGTTASPQITLLLSPALNSQVVMIVTLNYQDTPNFYPGGVQVQLWDGEACLGYYNHGTSVVVKNSEKWNFTTFIETRGSKLTGGISKGTFPTFGNIPSGGATVSASKAIASFPNYTTIDTLKRSGVLLGDIRVQSIKIKQVRVYDAEGDKKDLGSADVFP